MEKEVSVGIVNGRQLPDTGGGVRVYQQKFENLSFVLFFKHARYFHTWPCDNNDILFIILKTISFWAVGLIIDMWEPPVNSCLF